MRDIIYRPMCSTNMVNCLFDGFNHGYPLPQHPFGMQGLRLGATAGRRFLAATVVQVPYSRPRHRVLSFRYMQSRTRVHTTPTCDYIRL